MTSRKEREQPVDPQLEEMLDLLRPTPPMDAEMAARGQAKFMAEMEELFGPLPSSPLARLAGWISTLYRPEGKYTMATSRQKFVFATLAVFIVMFVLVFGGVSATAYASQFSLPGDALYPVKTSLEQTQLGLSLNAARQAELQLEFAQRRLDEVATLIEEGRYNDIETATSEFEYHIQQAIDTLELVAAGDPARAEELAAKIASALSSYASTLSGMMANVPEAVKPAFERAMNVFQPAGSVAAEDHDEIEFTGVVETIEGNIWTVAGRMIDISQAEIKGSIAVGDVVKVHTYRTGDGTLVAREIELVIEDEIADDDVLGNENENMNGDDNENSVFDNMNGNDNDIENMNGEYNGNENDNFNGDDHNGNVNDNTNDNENANHNDNSNDNSHDNGNDNGHDNGNSNDNDNSSNNNGNDNSGGDD
jgi:hypothetical protein